MLKIGIVGTGNIANMHMAGWKELKNAKVVLACDVDAERAKKFAQQYAIPEFTGDALALFKRKDIDAVDICTPNLQHYTLSLAAMKSGKHVLCEKPLAMNPAQIEEMIASSKKHKVKLTGISNQRFCAEAQAIKRFIDSGAAGKIYYAEARWLRRRHLPGWNSGFLLKKLGGGPCLDIGVHALDVAMYFMGNPRPVSVSGISGNFIAKKGALNLWGPYDKKIMDVEDFAGGFVRFDNGAALSLSCSFMSNIKEKEENTIRLFGDKAGLCYPSAEYFTEKAGSLIDGEMTNLKAQAGHTVEIAKFADFITGKSKINPLPPEQSLDAIKVLDGIHRSQRAGREIRF